MWAEFQDESEQESPRLRVATPGHARNRLYGREVGRGVIWLLISVLVLTAGTIGLSPVWSDLAESATSSAGREVDRHARFQPGGMAVDQIAAVSNKRWALTDGCLVAGQLDYATPERAALSRLFETINSSPTGAALLREAATRGVRVCFDRDTNLLAYYFASMNVVGVNWELSEGGRIIFLAHELAHIPQHPRYSDNRYFPPEDLVLLRRMREAAAEATATRIAWELQAAGFAAAWEEKLATPYADVAQAFARAAQGHQVGHPGDRSAAGAMASGTLVAATRAAFDQWFAAPWRRDVYDRMTVAHLQRIATDTMGLVPARRALTDRFLVGIGRVSTGRVGTGLGRMSRHGSENFLSTPTARPLSDAYYAGNLSAENARKIEHLKFHTGTPRRSIAKGRFTDVVS